MSLLRKEDESDADYRNRCNLDDMSQRRNHTASPSSISHRKTHFRAWICVGGSFLLIGFFVGTCIEECGLNNPRPVCVARVAVKTALTFNDFVQKFVGGK